MADKAYKPVGKLVKIYTGGNLTPPKFMPSLYEWLSIKGKIIHGYKSINDDVELLYKVPKGKVFFLVSVNLMAGNTGLVSLGTLDFEINDIPILTVQAGTSTDGVGYLGAGNTSVSFSIPYKMRSTETIKIRSNRVNSWIRGCFFGYEVDEKDILII